MGASPVFQVLGGPRDPSLKIAALDTLSALVFTMGPNYAVYVSVVKTVVDSQRLSHPAYPVLVRKLIKGTPFSPSDVAGLARYR